MQTMSFWNLAQSDPEFRALIDPDGREWSRGELFAECNRIVHGLRAAGLEPGDTVAAMLPNCAQFLAINLAVTQAGFMLVPLNWHLAGAEVAYILKDSEAKAFFCHRLVEAAARTAAREVYFPLGNIFALGKIEGFGSYEELVSRQSALLPDDRRTGSVMFYTSGTTGRPKGVRRPIPQDDPDTVAERYTMLLMLFGIGAAGDNVHFCGSPLYHTAAMNWSTSSLHYGHSVVLHQKWEAETMLRAVDQHRVTTCHLVPTQMVRLNKMPKEARGKYQVSSMTHMIHTAAPISVEVKRELIDWWGSCIYEYYASTEGGGTLVDSETWLRYPGTVGQPWPIADIKIFDDDGNELSTGEVGGIYMLMSDLSRFEYRGDKEKTEKNRLGDYFTAGDVGYLNDDGFLFLCDRKIDMIISGGANIYPAEIESVLITHPKVYDCCVFGIPNDDWGEEIKAVVQPAENSLGDETLTREILDYCEQKLARMKLPRSIDYMDELPRDPNGKLYKRSLRDPYWEDRGRAV